jgi:hypothetical protein
MARWNRRGEVGAGGRGQADTERAWCAWGQIACGELRLKPSVHTGEREPERQGERDGEQESAMGRLRCSSARAARGRGRRRAPE